MTDCIAFLPFQMYSMYLYLDLSDKPCEAELLFDWDEAPPPLILVSLSLCDF